jgi:hypothetical protein
VKFDVLAYKQEVDMLNARIDLDHGGSDPGKKKNKGKQYGNNEQGALQHDGLSDE